MDFRMHGATINIKFLKFIIVAFTLFNALVSTAEIVCRRLRFSRLIDKRSECFVFGSKRL
jgi:hypothetical protein